MDYELVIILLESMPFEQVSMPFFSIKKVVVDLPCYRQISKTTLVLNQYLVPN